MLDLMRIIAFFALMNGGLDIAVGLLGLEKPHWLILDGAFFVFVAVAILLETKRTA